MNAPLPSMLLRGWSLLAVLALVTPLVAAATIVPGPPTRPYAVRLIPQPDPERGWIVRAELDLASSGYTVSWHDAVRASELIRAHVTITPPPHDLAVLPVITTVRHEYELGHLPAGVYRFVLATANTVLHATTFVVGPPVSVAHLHVQQGDASWFADLSLAVWRSGQRVVDWGEPRREGNIFFLEPELGLLPEFASLIAPFSPIDFAPPNLPPPPLALLRHTYNLGLLEPGAYEVVVLHADRKLASRSFAVAPPPPVPGGPHAVAELRTLVEPVDAYTFKVTYHAPAGLDLPHLRTAVLHVTPAEISPYARIMGLPVDLVELEPLNNGATQARATYAVTGPGGDWDPADRGLWRVRIDPNGVRDLLGRTLARAELGVFRVFALPPPTPGPTPKVADVKPFIDADGLASVTALFPGVPADFWSNIEWGTFEQRGSVFHVQVNFRHHGGEITLPAFAPLNHTWTIGPLAPGTYVFLVRSNLGHHGRAVLSVPGDPVPPFTAWRERMIPVLGLGPDGPLSPEMLAAYAFGLNPALPNGGRPAGVLTPTASGGWDLTFGRAAVADGVIWSVEATADFRSWTPILTWPDVDATVVDLGDGREQVTVHLSAALAAPWRAFRLHVAVPPANP